MVRALHTDSIPQSLPLIPSSQLCGHDGPIQCVRFTDDDGKYCITGGHDRTVRLWNPFRYDPASNNHNNNNNNNKQAAHKGRHASSTTIPSAMPIQSYTSGYTHPITAVYATTTTQNNNNNHNSSQILLAASQKTLVLSDLITQQCLRRFQGHHVGTINQISVGGKLGGGSADVYLTASYDGTVALWDGRSSDFKPLQVLKEAKDSVTDVQVSQSASSSTTTHNHRNTTTKATTETSEVYIRTASIDGILRTYDLRRGILHSDDCGSPITSFALTKDGQCVVVSCLDGTIRLLQVDSGELLNTYSSHKAGNYNLQVGILANDSTIVSASEDGICVLNDLVQAHKVQALEVSPGIPVCTVATHPTISSVVITASYDATTTVWSHDSSPFYSD